jgi:uncharacterized damage-inducible protein DinB
MGGGDLLADRKELWYPTTTGGCAVPAARRPRAVLVIDINIVAAAVLRQGAGRQLETGNWKLETEMTEVWLRGPLEGIDPYLMPAAHALMQAREELGTAVEGLSAEEVWRRPGNIAAIGFHLRHIGGATDRLLTYAAGEMLRAEQMLTLRGEGEAGEPQAGAEELLAVAQAGIDAALERIRTTPRESLLERRDVGRKKLPSNVIGLLFHIAEHTQRHVGQVVTTAKLIRAETASAS